MNPYIEFSDLLFTCVDAPKAEVVATMLAGFNQPSERSLRNSKGDPIVQYFAKETMLDFSLAYINHAERDTTKAQRVILWEPRIHPRKTVFMGGFHDGMSFSVSALSLDSPYTWINVRIYKDADYPGSFFEYYADFGRIERTLMACKDEEGWDFAQEGPIQSFENAHYYTRRLKKDRLNREIITEYMQELDFMIAEDDFWRTDKHAHFLWQESPPVADT